MPQGPCIRTSHAPTSPYQGTRPPAGSCHSLGGVDVLAVDHLEDGASAGSVAVLVHGDLAGDAGKVPEIGEAASNLIAVGIEIAWIVGYTGCLDAVLVGIDDVVGPRAAIGGPLATVPIDDLLQIGLYLRSGVIE